MRQVLTGVAIMLATATAASAQPAAAVDITAADVQAVLKAGGPSVDHTLKVIDMGTYQLSVAVIHRGPTTPPGARGAARGPAPDAVHCGLATAPPGAAQGPGGMIAHDDTVETYIVIGGSGTLVTGGQIVNGTRSAPDSEVTKILNGPSCTGTVVGDIVSRKVGVGDITVIPAPKLALVVP